MIFDKFLMSRFRFLPRNISVLSIVESSMKKRPASVKTVALRSPGTGLERALMAAQIAEDNRGTNVLVLDMRN